MLLLTKPRGLDFNQDKQYEEFRFFKLALTERNWTGRDYITRDDCAWFMHELKELDDIFFNLFGDKLSTTRFTFLMDTSVFSRRLPENIKLLEFLEELDDFSDVDSVEGENKKFAGKYLKKLRNYANKQENLTYIYRWSLMNSEHPFSAEIGDTVLNYVKEIGLRAKNAWLREMKEVHDRERKMLSKGTPVSKTDEYREEQTAKVIMNCEKRDREFTKNVLKFGLDEPTLFFYGVYFLVLYFKQMEGLMTPGVEFVSFERKDKDIDVFLKDSTEQLNDLFLKHEAFISSLPKTPRRADGFFNSYISLYEVKNVLANEGQAKSIFKTISKWIINRIPADLDSFELPKKKWVHKVNEPSFKEVGLAHMYFEDISFVGGPTGEELLIRCNALISNGKKNQELLFPIFDPDSWENLNASQCAIITYALCLFHDVCIEKSYSLVQHSSTSIRGEEFHYYLETQHGLTERTPLHFHEQNKSQHNRKSTSDKKYAEHWVSFHFRKLRENQSASQEAKLKAASYGIPELPVGFTFVDSFVRGDKEEVSQVKFSAIDVLVKTLTKLNTFTEQKHLENTH